jgi:hypothetical protein
MVVFKEGEYERVWPDRIDRRADNSTHDAACPSDVRWRKVDWNLAVEELFRLDFPIGSCRIMQ